MQSLQSLYQKYTGKKECRITPLTQSGSNRRYYRLTGDDSLSLIGVVGTSADENRAFVAISQAFAEVDIPAPNVLAISDNALSYIQTDLADNTLFDAIVQGRNSGSFGSQELALLHKTIAYLPDIQFGVDKRLDYSICYPQPRLDRRNVWFDLNYFKYCFLKTVGVEFDEIALDKDFETLAKIILQNPDEEVFMYRDFQSRNVMIKDDTPYFIDFQGGRKGSFYYDVASFLWQAKANFSKQVRNELIDTYLERLQRYRTISKTDFMERLKYFVLFRQLQVLGAYGFRGLIEKKPHFIESIPLALRNLKELTTWIDLPFVSDLCNNERIKELMSANSPRNADQPTRLQVRIESFSYKKGGIPIDYSGNGGGYVFDCRYIHNPGRYPEYKYLTGRDKAVKDFLLAGGEVQEFLANVYAIVTKHIEVYSKRGFTHLSVFFGCTGGQHRSVFCAESLAEYLKDFEVEIKLKHNELY